MFQYPYITPRDDDRCEAPTARGYRCRRRWTYREMEYQVCHQHLGWGYLRAIEAMDGDLASN